MKSSKPPISFANYFCRASKGNIYTGSLTQILLEISNPFIYFLKSTGTLTIFVWGWGHFNPTSRKRPFCNIQTPHR